MLIHNKNVIQGKNNADNLKEKGWLKKIRLLKNLKRTEAVV